MENRPAWQWILLLLGLYALFWLTPIPNSHDFYGLFITSGVLVMVWLKLNHQEQLFRPFTIGLIIYWLGYIFDYADGLLKEKGRMGYIVDTADDLLFAIGFFLIALAFLRVMNHRSSLIDKLNAEIQRSQEMQNTLHQQAYTDELTGLGNRRALFENLDKQISTGESGTVLYIDVNNFKPVNDRFGHDVGDLVLQECAKFLAFQGALAFRLGGDEFVALLKTQNPNEWIISVSGQAKQLAQEYGVTFSIGIARFAPDIQLTADELISQADQQMYREKVAKKNRSR